MLFAFYKIAGAFKYLPFLVFIIFGYDIFRFFKNLFTKEKNYEGTLSYLMQKHQKATTIITIVLFLLSAFSLTFNNKTIIHYLGCREIETLDDGQYSYYVKASSESGKTYTLPAKLIVDWGFEDNDEGHSYAVQTYTVENVYFKNGGYLYFDEPETIYEFSDTVYQYDQNFNEWEIGLTKKKVSTNKFKETSLYSNTDFVLFFVFTGLLIIDMLIFTFYYLKYSHL